RRSSQFRENALCNILGQMPIAAYLPPRHGIYPWQMSFYHLAEGRLIVFRGIEPEKHGVIAHKVFRFLNCHMEVPDLTIIRHLIIQFFDSREGRGAEHFDGSALRNRKFVKSEPQVLTPLLPPLNRVNVQRSTFNVERSKLDAPAGS